MPQSATPQAEMEAAADRTGDQPQEVPWGVWAQHPHKGQGPCLARVGSSGGCGQAWAASAPGTSELWWPTSRRRAAVSSVQGMRSSPTPGHPEEKAIPPGHTGHVGLPGAASSVVSGAGCGWHRACLPAQPQGVCGGSCQGPHLRVLRAACVPTAPHHLRWAPSLQHLPHYLQDRLSPQPWAGPCPAAIRLLPWLEEDQWAPWGLRSRPPLPTAICQPPCGNGGSCVHPGHCHCPAGWQGDTCQTDVDECSTGGAGCPQRCVNTAGSYWCQCWEGHGPSADGTLCLPKGGPPRVAPGPTTGVDSMVREEVRQLQSRVDMLEQKLQLVLAPLHSLASRAVEQGLQDPGRLLAHSLQQLDRIDSLSEQISFLEEQLGSCSCKKEL
ncbi:epidermal growth factor-like protein 7 isoform X1 [Marmota flaviventris]|uniref:epidermal growth factor-like protein 7 isoform X1 n=1 Tax=Marmota flaviventris TaxID=93162 RepID=UPI003A8A3C4E